MCSRARKMRQDMKQQPFEMDQVEAFLCQGIRHIRRIDPGSFISSYRAIGDAAVFESAKANDVESIVAHVLLENSNEIGDLPGHWHEAYENTERRISSYLRELDIVAMSLAAKSIPMAALKNSGIARHLYKYPGANPMGDIDVVISPDDFFVAHEVMVLLGYKLKFRNEFEQDDIQSAFAGGGAEYSKLLDDGQHLWFELQWRPVAGKWIRPEQEPNAADILSRATRSDDTEALLLAPEDNLLQVCLHTAKHSFVRAPGFRLHTDVERIVEAYDIDWSTFVATAEKMNVRTPVYFSLYMAKILLDSNVPEFVLKRLRPSALKRKLVIGWLNRVGVFNPDDPKWSKMGYMYFRPLRSFGSGIPMRLYLALHSIIRNDFFRSS
jgi:hypothetical protein